MRLPVSTNRVAILAAMPPEIRPLTKRLGLRRETLGNLTMRVGRVGPIEVVATTTGMGTDLARRVTAQVLDACAVDHVIVIGIAGGVGPQVHIGDVIVPEVVIDRESGIQYHPLPLGEAGAEGALVTGDALEVDADALIEMGRRGVLAVDMETAAIGAMCEARDVPWSVLRAVSDHIRDGLVDQAIFDLDRPHGTPDLAAVARYILRRPGDIPKLVRLGRDMQIAAHAAADATMRACAPTR